MPKKYHFRRTADEATALAAKLLSHRPTRTEKMPEEPGVYLIRHKQDGYIYVGISTNLKHRVHGQHRSASTSLGSSSFQRSASKRYGVRPGRGLKQWVDAYCTFAFVPIQDENLMRLVEQMVIVTLKRAGEPLLNKK